MSESALRTEKLGTIAVSRHYAAMQHDTNTSEGKAALCGLAIECRVALGARYNGAEVELHPHQVVERNGAMYLRAVNPAKGRRVDEDPALGLFHLDGLSDIALRQKTFDPLPVEAIAAARSTDVVRVSI